MATKSGHLKARQKLDKYEIVKRLSSSQFADVYSAIDQIEGTRVALKVPLDGHVSEELLKAFKAEARLAAQLDHPNILPLKNASFIGERFVIVFPLGERNLSDRLTSRVSAATALDFADQILGAAAHAHLHRIIHCDIKPDNIILFRGPQLRLCDFGIAKIARRTVQASGSGTLGYMAPEQAMGKPSFRSDVFSCGLIMYRMLTGHLPDWPFDWPPPNFHRLRRFHPDLIDFLRRAIDVRPARRFADAIQMHAAFRRLRPRALKPPAPRRAPGAKAGVTGPDWREVRKKEFLRSFGRSLDARYTCHRCDGPLSEAMRHCPWCAAGRAKHRGETKFPAQCPRCKRGRKLDWRFCAWCYGPGFADVSPRSFPDKRYQARCDGPDCPRGDLMPFMCYCPWCRRRVRRKWALPDCRDRCAGCGWGVAREYWRHCPWCGRKGDPR